MGPSRAVTRLIAEVTLVAKTNFSVLILGETGVGKDLVAGAVHKLSSRSRVRSSQWIAEPFQKR